MLQHDNDLICTNKRTTFDGHDAVFDRDEQQNAGEISA